MVKRFWKERRDKESFREALEDYAREQNDNQIIDLSWFDESEEECHYFEEQPGEEGYADHCDDIEGYHRCTDDYEDPFWEDPFWGYEDYGYYDGCTDDYEAYLYLERRKGESITALQPGMHIRINSGDTYLVLQDYRLANMLTGKIEDRNILHIYPVNYEVIFGDSYGRKTRTAS